MSDRNSDGQTKRDTVLPKGCGPAVIIQIIQPSVEIKVMEMNDAYLGKTQYQRWANIAIEIVFFSNNLSLGKAVIELGIPILGIT